jgi:peptide/nickel transport system substrate-binding protein
MEGSASAPAKKGMSMKVIAIVVVAVLLVAGVGVVLLTQGGSAKYDASVFRYGSIAGNFESLDPAVDYETAGGEILQNVYETLVFYNGASSSDLKGMLATEVPTIANGGISEDGLTYIFHLRSGVKFADNTTMTSTDVKYSFDRALMLNDPNGPWWMYGQVLIPGYYGFSQGQFGDDGKLLKDPYTKYDEKAKKDVTYTFINQTLLDKHIWASNATTIQFNLTSPYPAFLYTLAFNGASIVSKAYVEAHGGLSKAGFDYMFNHAMGTGPYMISEIKTDSYIKLVANPYYWRTAPSIKTVIISQIADDSARILALKNRDVDAAAIPRAQRAAVEGAPNITIVAGNPTFNVDFIGLNQAINVTGADKSKTNVPTDFLADRNVRLAFAHAFNFTLYLTETLQGTAIQPNGAIPKGMFAYNATVPLYDYNLTMAEEYLGKALDTRTADSTTDTYLDNGFNLEIFYNAGNSARQSACMLFKSGLESLNPGKITVTVTGLEWSAYLEYRKTLKMPVMFLGWAPDYADPDDYVQPFFLSGGTYAAMIGYKNTTLDDNIAAAAAELDTEARAELYYQLSMDMYNECVYIWTAQATNFFVGHDYIQGYYFNPMFSNLYYYDLAKKASP